MFLDQPHLLKDSLGETYAFTLWPRVDADGYPEAGAIPQCRTYARQTLESIVASGHDPFHYGLEDLWLDVYQRPWARPTTLRQMVDDLAAKIASGELLTYLEDSPLWEDFPETGPEGNMGEEEAAPTKADTPRVQDAPAYNAPVAPPPLSPIEARKERYRTREELVTRTADIPTLQGAGERLAFNNDSILRAEAALYVYKVDEYRRGHISQLPDPPVGLEVIDHREVPGLEEAVFTDPETGFGAALFESEINGETMLTYRGTNNGVTGSKDWPTNFKQGFGKETEQYNQAMHLAQKADLTLGDSPALVGHSLGGGLASAAVAVTSNRGYTFNSAGLHPDTASREGGLTNGKVAELIQTQAVEGEFLTMLQRHGNKAFTGLMTGLGAYAAGYPGAALGAMASSMLPDFPRAVGEMQILPRINGGHPLTRHGMDQVIDGIEAQKKQDIELLTNYA